MAKRRWFDSWRPGGIVGPYEPCPSCGEPFGKPHLAAESEQVGRASVAHGECRDWGRGEAPMKGSRSRGGAGCEPIRPWMDEGPRAKRTTKAETNAGSTPAGRII